MKITFFETVSGVDIFFQGRREYDLPAEEANNWINSGLAYFSGVPEPVEPPPAIEKKKPKKKEAE